MKCPQCQKEDAIVNSEYGVLPGKNCQVENDRLPKPAPTYDFASPLTKLHRKEFSGEMVQPWINGVLSKEFIEINGTDKISVTPEDIKKAKYVYGNMTRHHKMLQGAKIKKTDVSKNIMSKRVHKNEKKNT